MEHSQEYRNGGMRRWSRIAIAASTALLLMGGALAPSVYAQEPTAVFETPSSIKDAYGALGMNAGVAIDTREVGNDAAKQVVLKNFNQITAENDMKPEYWYNDAHEFSMPENAKTLLHFAADNGLAVYGHVLAWHSQTPDWFFQADENCEDQNPTAGVIEGCALASKDQMLERERVHIENVAKAITDEFGKFGSDTNPIKAFDVVNETINDGDSPETNGMRNSLWYQITGEDYIDKSFEYANQYLNGEYAEPGVTHPVTLFINDYNTDSAGKLGRYQSLIKRLVERNVPFDGIGHQMHIQLTTSTANVENAFETMSAFGKKQAITELDVATGTPVTQAKLVEQGQFYYKMNQIIKEQQEKHHQFFSVSVWGVNDGRSWRNSEGAPLLFNDEYRAKPAYTGFIGDKDNLPETIKTMNVFKSAEATVDAALPSDGTTAGSASIWSKLPSVPFSKSEGAVTGKFLSYWNDGTLTTYADINDATRSEGDAVTITVGDARYVVDRLTSKADNGATAAVVERADGTGYQTVVTVPAATAENTTIDANVQATDAATNETNGWNAGNVKGTMSLIQQLYYTETNAVPADAQAPVVDGDGTDAVWQQANEVSLDAVTSGVGQVEAQATAKTLWKGNKLYALVQVKDPNVSLTNSNPWEKDSVEVFIDRGNTKGTAYTDDIQQIRVSADGKELSFGSGAATDVQAARVAYGAKIVDGGYSVEMAIDLGEGDHAGTFQGLDFQINDAKDGARVGTLNWANLKSDGYKTAEDWGVARLVTEKQTQPVNPDDGKEDAGDNNAGDADNKHSNTAAKQDGASIADTGSSVLPLLAGAIALLAVAGALTALRRHSL
ncbi:endo-1,4-beta-xylanase [Bifidobacterium imperatoris]|uniref:Beta-xylanase n=1 Tax=Bifidobacterium imperatoris TaxID=2020965 RepID=A0A2N5IQY2_9BIFI|nr:endo-1,4-beta-xylanase [Bifidobacterium imperatoris]PLS24366.1 endo-1,4-beta-xylanase [Bifidobacterium imperatoris]QSY56935.1 endo-1,4-beta-xylanase [Bifidobacterium imperatoris]